MRGRRSRCILSRAKHSRICATGRTSSWTARFACHAISAIRPRSTAQRGLRALVISGTHVAVLAAAFLFLLRICFLPESAALFVTVLAAWLYALVTGWQAPCVRSAAGLTLFMIGGYFFRERRIMNLLAAVALGFLLFDPDQLFDARFQLTFLAVGFLGAFGAPAIAATSGPLAAALSDLGDTGRDLHLLPRAAQFRIEMRLLAKTLGPTWPVTITARAVFFVYEIVLTSAVVQLELALPMVVYFDRVGFSGLSANAFVVPLMDSWCRSDSRRCSRGGVGRRRSQGDCSGSCRKWSGGMRTWSRTGASRHRRYGSGLRSRLR